jgi:hypothetical protein
MLFSPVARLASPRVVLLSPLRPFPQEVAADAELSQGRPDGNRLGDGSVRRMLRQNGAKASKKTTTG